MKIFVTGGTGFIGGHFINEVPEEIEILAIRRNKNQSKIKINRQINWINKELDCIEPSDLKGINAIVHFASAGVSPQKATWEELYYYNVNCTLKLLRATAEAGVNKIFLFDKKSNSFFELLKIKFMSKSNSFLAKVLILSLFLKILFI